MLCATFAGIFLNAAIDGIARRNRVISGITRRQPVGLARLRRASVKP
jgi:hypothetical protein